MVCKRSNCFHENEESSNHLKTAAEDSLLLSVQNQFLFKVSTKRLELLDILFLTIYLELNVQIGCDNWCEKSVAVTNKYLSHRKRSLVLKQDSIRTSTFWQYCRAITSICTGLLFDDTVLLFCSLHQYPSNSRRCPLDCIIFIALSYSSSFLFVTTSPDESLPGIGESGVREGEEESSARLLSSLVLSFKWSFKRWQSRCRRSADFAGETSNRRTASCGVMFRRRRIWRPAAIIAREGPCSRGL